LDGELYPTEQMPASRGRFGHRSSRAPRWRSIQVPARLVLDGQGEGQRGSARVPQVRWL